MDQGKITHWTQVKRCVFKLKGKWYEDKPKIVLDIRLWDGTSVLKLII